ncbi:GDP-mannose 4,6-dehydratase [Prochlorococcus sp. MIT 0801]|uniref:GDP-mannose 4,6-dehydratase n=1 Tax=Prochlorococcus sp. MIT 0801 TaxID=1501269 RepID=UPI0004F83112|nr:GDP-mannose 4,6-dehydratase [Prochlorococcus sp. MIT 0801]AIQ98278.1 dTDP-glucose 4,6-dehydratase [Prochlorococcus sp. MIT 0801]
MTKVPSKSCFVIGCTGQDGSMMCRSLLKKGFEVVGLTRKINYSSVNFKKLDIRGKFKVITLDLKNHEQYINLIEEYQPSEIYNLSAQSSVGLSFEKPLETYQSIINATYNLLEICRKANYEGRIFFAGSSEIYGNVKGKAKINDPKVPINPYALAKISSMNFVKFYREIYKLNCLTGVLFNHESTLRAESFVTQKIITGAIKSLRDQQYKFKVGNVDIIRDWGDAEEYVEAMQIITRATILKDQIICTGKGTSLREFINKVFSQLALQWEKHVEIEPNLFRKSDIQRSVGNPEDCFNDTGWKSSVDIDSLIKKLIKEKINK